MRTAGPATGSPLLGIYLNDHLAGATGGTELLRRIARAHRGRAAGPRLVAIAREVGEDRSALRSVMARLGVHEQRMRVALGWLGEKAARAKTNGRLLTRSPLSDVLELEAARMGVEGKTSLWRTLRTLADSDDRLDAPQLDRLLDRANRQAAELETVRVQAAREALGGRRGR